MLIKSPNLLTENRNDKGTFIPVHFFGTLFPYTFSVFFSCTLSYNECENLLKCLSNVVKRHEAVDFFFWNICLEDGVRRLRTTAQKKKKWTRAFSRYKNIGMTLWCHLFKWSYSKSSLGVIVFSSLNVSIKTQWFINKNINILIYLSFVYTRIFKSIWSDVLL